MKKTLTRVPAEPELCHGQLKIGEATAKYGNYDERTDLMVYILENGRNRDSGGADGHTLYTGQPVQNAKTKLWRRCATTTEHSDEP